MNIAFIPDGEAVATYQRTSDGSDCVYNRSIWTSGPLASDEHTLVVQVLVGLNGSYMAFDYSAYE